jgi:hypothetical protein
MPVILQRDWNACHFTFSAIGMHVILLSARLECMSFYFQRDWNACHFAFSAIGMPVIFLSALFSFKIFRVCKSTNCERGKSFARKTFASFGEQCNTNISKY